ncbi:hypothetical protein EJ074_20595 [Mesorhizobium sp. M3A.F.Ca.ET.080.04.2.1]|nr:hypothetical protein EJ074_20595 [Mesorhizobium sp. M3A.F.Ca.ET.080.04.2.1]RWF24879.1 MAG: hypothetical protein EOS64_06330 [Mesorhizobium sp.]
MHLHNETPLLSRNGGSVFEKVWTPAEYRIPLAASNEIASRHLAARHRLPLHIARLICELARIGGRAAA